MATTTLSLIGKQTVGADGASSVTFSNIPQTYTDLQLVMSLRGNGSSYSGSGIDGTSIKLNGATTNYSWRQIYGTGTGVGSTSGSSILYLGIIDGSNATTNTFSSHSVTIPNYTSSNYKSLSIDTTTEHNGSEAYAQLIAGLWSNTSATTSIEIVCEIGRAHV